MTSTLSNFPASPANPAATAALSSSAMGGLASAPANPADGSATGGMPVDFAALLPVVRSVAVPAAPMSDDTTLPVESSLPAMPSVSGTFPGTLPLSVSCNLATPPAPRPFTGTCPQSGEPLAATSDQAEGGSVVASTITRLVAEETGFTEAISGTDNAQPAAAPKIPREVLERAMAFVTSLVQTLLPAAMPALPAPETAALSPEAGATPLAGQADLPVAAPTDNATGSPLGQSTLLLPNGRPFPAQLPVQAKAVLGNTAAAPGSPTAQDGTIAVADEAQTQTDAPAGGLTLPNGRVFKAPRPEQAKPSLAAERSTPSQLPIQARPDVTVPRSPRPAQPAIPDASAAVTDAATPSPDGGTPATPVSSAPVFTVADDGAIECKLTLPAAPEPVLKTGGQTDSPLEFHAELEVPGQAVVRVEAAVAGPGYSGADSRQVNFAGQNVAGKSRNDSPIAAVERKFVFTGDKRVKTASPESGITVAKTESTMPVAPTEEISATRNPETLSALPPRADVQVVQSPAERITAAPTEPAEQNFAERAVATVTGLAEAQFSASMNKAGSVQLRLKFGGEDLSVRVELRDGTVHTDFRTDSPALRDALTKEWQAVAASTPGHLQRFLDPVFSPGSATSSTDTGTQQNASQRQTPQQQAQEQGTSRQDHWSGQSPFSRRSALSESFVPEPAAPRVPVLLPTSLRLSALA